MHEVRSQLGNSTDQWRLLKGLMDVVYEITRGYKVTLRKTQVSRFCVVNYEYFDNHSQFLKKNLSAPQQSCSIGIARKSPRVATHKHRRLM